MKVAALVLLTIVVCTGIYAVSEVVPDYGLNIESAGLRGDWLLAAGWSLVLTWLLLIGSRDPTEQRVICFLWAVKVFICLFISLLYEAHYDELDAFTYFSLAKGEWGGWNIGLGMGTENVLALSWLHQQVFPEGYHVLKVTFAAIGMFGIRCFYAAAKTAFPDHVTPRHLLLLGLVPSLAFWSSIIGKDPVGLLAVGMYALGVSRWLAGEGRTGWLWMLSGIALASGIRIWLCPVIILPVVILAVAAMRGVWRQLLGFSLASLLLALGVYALSEHFSLSRPQDALVVAGDFSRAWATGGSAQEVVEFGSFTELGMALPWWTFSFLFRPFPGEIPNAFGLLSGLENITMLALCLWAVWVIALNRYFTSITVWLALVIITYSMVFSIAGYQNLGTAVRWRLPLIPFMMGLMLVAQYVSKCRSRVQHGRPRSEIGTVGTVNNE